MMDLTMKLSTNKVPSPKNKVVKQVLNQGVEDAKRVLKRDLIPEGVDLFGTNRELLAFEILRTSDESQDLLPEAKSVHERLLLVFRDVLDDIGIEDFIECMTLCLYGFILGNYTDEDFRFVYRYSLEHIRDQNKIEEWLRLALVFLALSRNMSEEKILSEIRFWIRYLGTPLWNPSLFSKSFELFNLDIESVMNFDSIRLVTTIHEYPEYLEESIGTRSYQEIRTVTKDWLPDVLSSRILSMFKKRVYIEAQKGIKENMDIQEAYKSVKKSFEKIGFLSDDNSIFPIRLHELPNPPPPDAVDPIVFEMIPKKLRVGLLPSVAYSTKIETIEVLFLGGPRIGRSGILIKTNTGGILLDFGLSVANQRIPEWVPELEMIDSVLVSHSHLDHIGGLPVLYDQYDGKWCSVGITGAITKVLLDDALKIGTPHPPRRKDKWDMISRFRNENIEKVSKNHVRLEIGKSNEVGPGIIVTPIDACHIPGSVAYLVDIEGIKILYTGDFNLDESLLFKGADFPIDCDLVIFDGTYWNREDFDRIRVTQQISEIVKKSGPIIIPSFAVGRSQEILTILEHLGITKTRNVMVAGMAEKVTKLTGYSGHWNSMKKNKVALEKEDILVAGGGMMGGGLIRQHFMQQHDNPEAAVILCGYLAPRTPGWNLLHGYEPHKCTVSYARLSAHSSASTLQKYIASCKGRKIIVHTPTTKIPKDIHMPYYGERISIPIS
jgi:putative mRNA 3-end processing factor